MLATPTLHEISQIVELAEAKAFADWWSAVPEEAASHFGLGVKQVDSATALIMSNFDISLFNSVVGVGVAEPATEAMIDRITALYAPAGNTFVVRVAPGAQPAELVSWLEQRGFKRGSNWAKVYRSNDEPPNVPTDLRIECIGPEYTGAFVQVGLTAFEMPPDFRPVPAAIVGRPGWRNYIAFDGDSPVAIASLFVRDGIGWLGNAATLQSHRRRGAQGALMARRIRDGIDMHCEWFATETYEETADNPNPSYHNMLRTGFKLAYLRANYVSMRAVLS
jgi:hypothetical protein